jgi:hypothetical protein
LNRSQAQLALGLVADSKIPSSFGGGGDETANPQLDLRRRLSTPRWGDNAQLRAVTYLLTFPALLGYRLDCLALRDCLSWVACFFPQVLSGMQMP